MEAGTLCVPALSVSTAETTVLAKNVFLIIMYDN